MTSRSWRPSSRTLAGESCARPMKLSPTRWDGFPRSGSWALMAMLSSEQLGHLGHALILTHHAAALMADLGEGRGALLRAPLRYLASFDVPDNTLVRARAALDDDAQTVGAENARAAARYVRPAAATRALAREAAQVLLRLEPTGRYQSELHLLTAMNAARELADRLQAEHGNVARAIAVRAGAWLDMALAGTTELGKLELRAPPKSVDVAEGATLIDEVTAAMRASDDVKLSGLARSTVKKRSVVPRPVIELTIELAIASGRGTIQHSCKLTEAALAEMDAAGSDPERWVYLASAWRLGGETITRLDPLYAEICSAMGVAPHPALGA